MRGKVRPSGRHRVKLVFRGPDRGVRGVDHQGQRDLRPALGCRADRQLRGARLRPPRPPHPRLRSSDARKLTTYRLAGASYYGPGLYGNGVACGGTLLPGTMGVANKTLPCGTKVKLRYHGRSVTVPVIDRGPYVAGRDYDLTEAVKEQARLPGVGTRDGEPLATQEARPSSELTGCRLRLGSALRHVSKEARRTPSRRTGRCGS